MLSCGTYMSETKPPKAEAESDWAEPKENARKARETANRLFPGEDWKQVEDGIYLSPNRPIGKKSHYNEEMQNARILRDHGYVVYLAPEWKDSTEKQPDAIVNGLIFEFKNAGGNANTLITHFLRSRSQAPNIFINLDKSGLTKREVMSALYSARNSKTRLDRDGNVIKGYTDKNRFPGGKIILKLKGQEELIHLNVDDLRIPQG